MNRLLIICIVFFFASCKADSGRQLTTGSVQFTVALEAASQKIDSGRMGDAEKLVNQVFRELQATPNDSLRWFVFSYNIYLSQGRYQDVIHLADSVIQRLKDKLSDVGLRRMYADALFAKGDAFYRLGVYPAGLRAYYLAQQVGVRYEDECVMGDFSFRLANINFKQERFQEAASHYHKALRSFKACMSPGFTAAAYHQVLLDNIALSLTRAGLTDSALAVFRTAQGVVAKYSAQYSNRKNYWTIARQVLHGNMAEALIQKKNFTAAENLLKEALASEEYLKLEPLDAMLTRLKLADVFIKTGQLEQGVIILEEIMKSHLLENHPRAAFQNYILWANIQEKMGNYKAATEAVQSALRYRDRFLEERRNYLMLNLDENIRLMNQADRNEALAAKVERNNLIIVITLLALLLILVAAALLYVNFRKSKQYVNLLKVLNSRIKNQNERLERTLNDLRLSNLEKDRIMQMVAHDLRSPVASIYWLANVMLEDENLNEEQRNNLELILLASNNSLSLTKDMLEAVSLLQTNELSRTSCDVDKLLRQQVKLHASSLEAKGLPLKVTMPDTPVEAQLDTDKFGQVMSNLLTNAIKFSREGGAIEVSLTEFANQLQLVIRDHGIGLQPGQEEKIFEAFSEARRNGTKGEKSYGLGLSIARRIVNLHGGRITARNHPDGGAVFTVIVPKEPVIDMR